MLDAMRWRLRLSDLSSLLETERDLIARGALDEIQRLSARREALEGQLASMPDDVAARMKPTLVAIRDAARRNHRLISAYLDGARQASARLGEMNKAAAEIGAYRKDGSRLGPASGPAAGRTLSTKA